MSSILAKVDNLLYLSCKPCAFRSSRPIHLLVLYAYLSSTAAANMVGISHEVAELTLHMLSSHMLYSIYHAIQGRYRIFSSLQKVLLSSAGLRYTAHIVSHLILYDLYCLA